MNQAVVYKIADKAKNLSNKVSHDDVMKIADVSRKCLTDSKKIFVTEINLINKEIKDIIKVIKSLENREILLRGTTRKITSQERGFSNFLRSLMTAGLPLMKSVLTPLDKNVLLPFGLS